MKISLIYIFAALLISGCANHFSNTPLPAKEDLKKIVEAIKTEDIDTFSSYLITEDVFETTSASYRHDGVFAPKKWHEMYGVNMMKNSKAYLTRLRENEEELANAWNDVTLKHLSVIDVPGRLKKRSKDSISTHTFSLDIANGTSCYTITGNYITLNNKNYYYLGRDIKSRGDCKHLEEKIIANLKKGNQNDTQDNKAITVKY